MKPLKIALAVHHFPPTFSGGAEWRAHRTARHLIEQGHDVRVICVESITAGEGRGWHYEDGIFEGVPVRRLSFDLSQAPDPLRWQFRNLWVRQAVADFVRAFQPDLLHLISGYLMTGSAIEAAKTAGLPVVLTLTDFWFLCPRINLMRSDGQLCQVPDDPLDCFVCVQGEKRRFRLPDQLSGGRLGELLKRPLIRGFFGLADAAQAMQERRHALSEALAQVDVAVSPSRFVGELSQARGARPRRLVVMRQGLDVSDWAAVEQAPPRRGLQVGYVGQLAPHKGVDVLIDAFRRLESDGETPRLTIYGDPAHFGPFAARLRQMAGDDPRITFGGVFPHPEVARVLASLDVVVVPSIWYENSPNSILEAFATRTPVVASDLGGMAELVQHEQNGLLFGVGDAADLARQLQRLVDEPGLLPRLRQGIGTIKTVQDEMAELAQIYRELVANAQEVPA